MKHAAIIPVLLLCAAAELPAAAPQRYINPLPIENSRSVADPTVIRYKDKYLLFLTGGMFWVSDDLVNWKHHPISLPAGRRGVSAPHAFEYGDYVYLTGNDTGLYRARDPMGAWEYIGDFKDHNGARILLFDTTVFVDADRRVYLYYSGRHSDGIYGVELDKSDLTRFAGPSKRLWTFDKSHIWERYGDNNEGTELSWLEAPWMTKHKGVYYLQYSAPGTEWKTYAVGVYTSKRPLGPYRYASNSPILVHKRGLINGTGHHSVVEGPGGGLWAIYTILYRNWGVFDRRVGMDPVGFDAKGNMVINGPSDTPQWAPGANPKAWAGNDSGSIAVSLNRYTWAVSSASPGRDAQYAFDDNVRTWWQPADNDPQPWLMLDLGCRNPSDANQEFLIDSARILFDTAPRPGPEDLVVDGHGRWFQKSPRPARPEPYRYKLEASLDNKTYSVVADRTENSAANNVEFVQFAPVRSRFVKLTITGAPKGVPTGVLEFTVFGKSAEGPAR